MQILPGRLTTGLGLFTPVYKGNVQLTLDIGNTAAKFGLFRGTQLLQTGLLHAPEVLVSLIEQHSVTHIMVASVGADPEMYRQAVAGKVIFEVLSPQTPVPVNKNYDTPLTLGADRLAAVVGAGFLFPGQNVLVIDAGTCITFDLLSAENIYLGGSISPGLDMRFKALHTFTARLPLVTKSPETALSGQSTEASIKSGVLNGTVAEVRELVQQYRKQYRNLTVVLCGGDSQFFETKLDTPIFAVPELVHIGLARILQTLHA